MSDSNKKGGQRPSTMAALLEDKPKRGRPPRNVSRQNVYVALSKEQKQGMSELAALLPKGLARADLPDMSITILSARLESLRRDVADRNREIPEGVTDFISLYLLWDLALPSDEGAAKWTSIRVSPQQAIELGRVYGTLNAAFGVNRSEAFGLGLELLGQYLSSHPLPEGKVTLAEVRKEIKRIYL